MKRSNLFFSLLLALTIAIAACERTPSLQGKWAVDVEATIGKAKAIGLPDSASAQIREIYDGGQLEITGDTLVMRVAGFPDAIARNYKVVGEAGHCYN
jgi:hypothetical protein